VVVVQKYGGSSVATVERIHQVADRVVATVAQGHQVVVVCSAMGNTTNELLALARQVSPAPGRRELDMLVSVGERIGMALLAMAINDRGVLAQSFTGSQSGIITDESHSNARVIAVRPNRLQAALDQGRVAIVAGFQGVSRDREVTTLGRGGSDTTAVVLAAALNAAWCEICSDVDGVYSADPRKVPTALKLDRMSLDEALALARGGGRILHDEAVAYAHRHNIALYISATSGNAPGTRIQVSPLPPRIAALASDSELEVFQGPDSVALLQALYDAGAPIRTANGHEVLVDLRNWPDREAFAPPADTKSRGRVAVITAVGSGIGLTGDLSARGIVTLRDASIPLLAWSSTADALSWRVAVHQADDAYRALHDTLLGRTGNT
jgi:aspartate kinase